MKSRTPTKPEKLYIEASKSAVGCVACYMLGHANDAPEEYLAFHHNPDVGNTAKFCHFFGYPLCPVHHQGATPSGLVVPPTEPIRHPPLGMPRVSFEKAIGNDYEVAAFVWDRLSEDTINELGSITGLYNFEDLVSFCKQYDAIPKK